MLVNIFTVLCSHSLCGLLLLYICLYLSMLLLFSSHLLSSLGEKTPQNFKSAVCHFFASSALHCVWTCVLFLPTFYLLTFKLPSTRCALASLLTVALHNNLTYLTEIMEVLLRDLMQQNSNTQPKLLLRRTESIVEKLLTNWMSICLYGFLRVSCSYVSFSLLLLCLF